MFEKIINIFYWLRLVLSPTLGIILIGFILYSNEYIKAFDLIYFAVFGIVLGILLAERIRKKHGTSAYSASILSAPDFHPTPIDKENSNKNTNRKIND